MPEFDKHRTRRIIYNDDADQQYPSPEGYGYNITDEQSFIDTRTTPTFDTHVDTYVWCLGNGAKLPWGAMNTGIWPALGSEERATDLIVEACHAKGMEVWGSLRMNDMHDSFMSKSLEGTNDPLKAEHPEYLIGKPDDRELARELSERHLWTAFNYEREEIRSYRLDYIDRQARGHDLDGFELDFTRGVWNFPLGRERELAPLMTDFVRQVRERLNEIGEERGRPYTFDVHVMDSVEKSHLLGQDVEAWLTEGLIDVLTVGMGYLPYALRLDEWKALGAKHGVPVYPSINTNTFINWYKQFSGPKRLERVSAWHDAIRATAAWWWANGADGIYLFNLFCQEDKSIGPMEKELVYAPLKEAGDPAALLGKNKVYAISPSSLGGFCRHGAEATPLPVPLETQERKLPLAIGPDANDPKARFTIHFWTTGGEDKLSVHARLNHKLLKPTVKNDASHDQRHYVANAGVGLMRAGFNELALWCSSNISESSNPMIVHEVLVEVAY